MIQSIRNFGLAAFAVLAFSSSAAHAFTVYAQTFVTPFQVTGQVHNVFPQTLFCSIRVQGIRSDGFPVWTQANVPVYPGTTGFAYVYTSYPFQFVNGLAFADCTY